MLSETSKPTPEANRQRSAGFSAMDEGFLRRIYKTSAVMSMIVGVFGTVYGGPAWGLSFLLAATWSIVNIWFMAQLVTELFQKRRKPALIVIFFLKVPVLYGLIWAYLVYVPWKISALLSGIGLPYAVIVLKALGNSVIQTNWYQDSLQEEGKETKQNKAQ